MVVVVGEEEDGGSGDAAAVEVVVLAQYSPSGHLSPFSVQLDPSMHVANSRFFDHHDDSYDSYALHEILPTRVNPLVSMMKVEAVPDST